MRAISPGTLWGSLRFAEKAVRSTPNRSQSWVSALCPIEVQIYSSRIDLFRKILWWCGFPPCPIVMLVANRSTFSRLAAYFSALSAMHRRFLGPYLFLSKPCCVGMNTDNSSSIWGRWARNNFPAILNARKTDRPVALFGRVLISLGIATTVPII